MATFPIEKLKYFLNYPNCFADKDSSKAKEPFFSIMPIPKVNGKVAWGGNHLFSHLNVLVVDDMPAIRRMLRQMLHQLGVRGNIDESSDGLEAWEVLQERSYDLVICDINMPRMNGLDLLKRLRGNPHYEAIPFLMITGEVSESIVAAAAESEVDGYLLKPFKITALENRLRAIIKKKANPIVANPFTAMP